MIESRILTATDTASFKPVFYFWCTTVGTATAAAAQPYQPADQWREDMDEPGVLLNERVCRHVLGGVVIRPSGVITETSPAGLGAERFSQALMSIING